MNNAANANHHYRNSCGKRINGKVKIRFKITATRDVRDDSFDVMVLSLALLLFVHSSEGTQNKRCVIFQSLFEKFSFIIMGIMYCVVGHLVILLTKINLTGFRAQMSSLDASFFFIKPVSEKPAV